MPFDIGCNDPWGGQEPSQGDKIVATIRIRRGLGWNPKPCCADLEGKRVTLQFAWRIESGIYRAEVAWMPTGESVIAGMWPRHWPSWIASGDLCDIVRLT